MRILLDTSAYSAAKRGQSQVIGILRQATFIGLNAVVLAELLSGFDRGSRAERNRRELHEFLDSPRAQVLVMGLDTADCFVLIQRTLREAGTPIPTHDLWIAATAMEHGLRVLTTDTHYRRVPTILTEYVDVHVDGGRDMSR